MNSELSGAGSCKRKKSARKKSARKGGVVLGRGLPFPSSMAPSQHTALSACSVPSPCCTNWFDRSMDLLHSNQ